jgi:hypothetical protein
VRYELGFYIPGDSILHSHRRENLKSYTVLTSVIVRRLLVTANVVPSSPILVTMMMEELRSSETSVLTRATRCNIPEDRTHHSDRRENLKSYVALTGWTRNLSPVRYEMGFYIPDDILHSHCSENLKCYIALTGWAL